MIGKIFIQNFKSIDSVTVSLEPVTVLVGMSGSGKSNILAAIRFVRDYLLGGELAAKVNGGWAALCPVGRTPEGFTASVQFRLAGFEEAYEYFFQLGVANNSQLQFPIAESLKLGDKILFSWEIGDKRNNAKKWIVAPKVVSAPAGGGLMLGSLPTLSEAVLAYTALSTGIGCHDFPSSVFKDLGSSQKQRGVFESGEIASKYDGLQDGGANYLKVFQRITQDLRSQRSRRTIVSRLQQLNPSISSIELDSIQNPSLMVVGHRVGEVIVPLELSQESDGFRRFFAHLLSLYQTPPRSTLMFDEPENGIYPGALSVLAEEFNASPVEDRGQIILTTHSPGLLDHFDDASIRVVEMDKETQRTVVGPLDKDQRTAIRNHLLLPGELLTVDQPRIDRNALTEATGA